MTDLITSDNAGHFFNLSLSTFDGMYFVLGKSITNGALEQVDVISRSYTTSDDRPCYQQVSCRLRVQYRVRGMLTVDLVDVAIRNGVEEYSIIYIANHVNVNGDFTIVFADDVTMKKISDPSNSIVTWEVSNE